MSCGRKRGQADDRCRAPQNRPRTTAAPLSHASSSRKLVSPTGDSIGFILVAVLVELVGRSEVHRPLPVDAQEPVECWLQPQLVSLPVKFQGSLSREEARFQLAHLDLVAQIAEEVRLIGVSRLLESLQNSVESLVTLRSVVVICLEMAVDEVESLQSDGKEELR